ncbi:MAG: haloacid dehalogenase [Candidatus Hodarchaeales archaeon]
MTIIAEFKKVFSGIREKLDENNRTREELLKLCRQSIRNSSLTIHQLHRNELEKAGDKIQKNATVIEQINTLAKKMTPSRFGMILTANQEYSESVFLYSFLLEDPFPSYSDLKVPYIAYLHGIPDFIGELRRVILDSLRKKEGLEIAIRALELMDELYTLLIALDYPDGLTYNLRRKTDMVRNLTEKTRGDVTLALNRLDLIETFTKMLKEYPPRNH